MRHAIPLTVAAAAFLAVAGVTAKAAPIAPGFQSPPSDVVTVAQRCGRGYHRGPRGGCRRNLTPAYPCYFVRGPFGRWRLVCR